MFESWPESKWQQLNVWLRVIMICMLMALTFAVIKMGLSPCDKCQFCDTHDGVPDQFGNVEQVTTCIKCTDIMKAYAKTLETNATITLDEASIIAMKEALQNFNLSLEHQ